MNMKSIIHKINKSPISMARMAVTQSDRDVPNGIDIIEELVADEGFFLTQVEDVPVLDRIICSSVMLGKGRTSDLWKEITIEEADDFNLLKQQYIKKPGED